MNTFEYIDELTDMIAKKKNNAGDGLILMEQHYQEMLNMLGILRAEMEMAEYNYVVKGLDNTIHTFGEYTVLQKQLNDEIILIQPLALGEEELAAVDMQSLCDILKQAKENDLIKQNIIVLPPNINVFKAMLALPEEKDEEL